MGSEHLLVDWTQHIPCDEEYYVPLFCRPTFKDFTTFEMATRLGRLTADPTNYTDKEGGLYYRTTNQRLYYRNATVWVPLGLGDGDVIFDPAGTAQQDNGVARWSTTSKYIQGSVASLLDTGEFRTPGRYTSIDNDIDTEAFVGRNVDSTTKFSVDHKGKMTWVFDATEHATLERLANGVIGSFKPGQYFSMPLGDSRVIAQRHLGGKGNAQGSSNFRCPIVTNATLTVNYPGAADSSTEVPIIDEQIPINGLAVGDMMHVKMLIQTSNGAMTKHIKFYIGGVGSPNTVSVATAGGSVFFVHLDFWLTRLSTGGYVGEIMATQQGAFVGTLDPHSYNGTFDFNTTALNILAVMYCGTTAGPYAADAIIVNGGFVEYFNM